MYPNTNLRAPVALPHNHPIPHRISVQCSHRPRHQTLSHKRVSNRRVETHSHTVQALQVRVLAPKFPISFMTTLILQRLEHCAWD